jgi:hypothetical protein
VNIEQASKEEESKHARKIENKMKQKKSKGKRKKNEKERKKERKQEIITGTKEKENIGEHYASYRCQQMYSCDSK